MSSRTSNIFIVEIVSTRADGLVSLPREYTEANLAHMATANASLHRMFYPVELFGEATTSSDQASNEASSKPVQRAVSLGFAAASLLRPSTKDGRIQIGPVFAKDMGISAGDVITVVPSVYQRQWKVANRIEIVPLNANESEVIEKNAYALQNSLMQSLRVLFPGQRVTLRTSAGVQATVVVSSRYADPPEAKCYVLTDGTELLVAVKNREDEEASRKKSQDAATASPSKALLRLMPRKLLEKAAQSGSNASLPTTTASSPSVTSAASYRGVALVHPKAIAANHWRAGETVIGALSLANAAWAKSAQLKEASEGDHESKKSDEGLFTTSYIRSNGTALLVDVYPGSEAFLKSIPDNTVYVPELVSELSDFTPITLYVKPSPEEQYTVNDASVLVCSNAPSSAKDAASANSRGPRETDMTVAHPCVRVLDIASLEEVHGTAFASTLAKEWRPSSLSSNPFEDGIVNRDLCNNNTLLVGPAGCGKSTIAAVAAMHSGRHVVCVDCHAQLAEMMEAVMAELNMCSPSLLLLDNFDAIASTAADGKAGGPPTAMTPKTDLMIQQWLLNPRRFVGSDVMVVACVPSLEEVQPSVKLPLCFPRVLKVPPALASEKKAAMMSQLFSAAVGPLMSPKVVPILVEVVGKMVENFTAGDLAALCAKISRWYAIHVKPTISAATPKAELLRKLSVDTIKPVAATFVPKSQIGIRFLGAAKEGSVRAPSWDDAGGLAEAKAALHDVLVLPLKFPKLFSKLPLKTKSGVLLHGPSGCGKTYLLSVAVAAEGLHCIVVNGPEIFGKYIGTSEQKIREIFESAQAAAPCVIFFDEFDSVAPRRGNSNTGVTDRVVNQLLCYLDGVEGRKDVYVVAATSRPDLIDPALLRPGRLDRQVACPMPDHGDRKSIFVAHLRKTVPIAAENQSLGVTDEDLNALADATDGYTSADIAGLVSSAHSQVLQSFFKLSGDTLLAQLADGGGVSTEKTDSSTESSLPFDIVLASNHADDKASQKATMKQLTESLQRAEAIHSGSGKGGGATDASDAAATQNAIFPKVSKADILHAMEKFSRSRESQKQHAEQPNEELIAKLAQLKKLVGTRQTSA